MEGISWGNRGFIEGFKHRLASTSLEWAVKCVKFRHEDDQMTLPPRLGPFVFEKHHDVLSS